MRLLLVAMLSIPAAFGQGTIQTIAGTGTCAFSGDNGPAAQAGICSSQGITVDSAGSIYFADTLNYRIRKIATNGVITTFAGSGIRGSSGDGGTAVYASIGTISQVVVDSGGHYVVFSDPEAHKIRYLSPGGAIQGIGTGNAVSAGDGLPWTQVSFNQPSGLVTFFETSGGGGGGGGGFAFPLAYIADAADNIVRRLDVSATSTIVGPGTPGQLGDGGPATAASLLNPGGMAFYNYALFIADTGHNRIRKVDLNTGIITTVAGDGTAAFGGDGGPATSAQISSPTYIAIDPNGNLYFTDSGNLRVRKIDTTGMITTVAGDGSFGFGPDNVPATTSSFMGVSGAALLSNPTRLLSSDGSSRLRQVLFGQTTQMGLSISPNPALQGDTINLTATVIPSAATGTVTFTANSQPMGTFSLAGGQAIGSWYPLNPGSYSVVASYSGDSTYAPSSITSTVNVQTATTTALSSSLNPSTQGQAVTFTMTVTPAASTGTVDLFGTLNGSPLYLGRATLVNGTASITTSTLGVGSNVLHAVYNSDATHARSTSPDLTQVVNAPLTSTTTSVTSSPNPSTAGTQVTLTATVSPSAATGSVQFYVNGSSFATATLSGGQAQITTPYLPTGVDSITATYSGDANNASSTSAAVQQTVNKVATTTTLSANPSPSTLGQSVTLTATVTPSNATGAVQFFNGATPLGTATIASGQAQLTTSSLPTGTNSLTATYNGDANNASSTSAAIQQTVNKIATTTTLSASPSPSTFGQSVTLTATVAPTAATGTVQFFNGATSLGTATVASGQAQLATTALPVGTNSLTAAYSGDATNASSTSAPIQQTVNKIATTTTLSASPSPSNSSQSVTLTATVTPSNATGTVQFFNGATSLGTATIASGQAQFATTALPVGTNSLTATYSGDATNASSTSAAIQQTVNLASSTTTLVASPSPSTFGQSVTLTATVTPTAATGTVQFFNGATSLGTATVTNGQAQLSATSLPVGTNSVTAAYSGDSNNAASTSTAVPQTVNKAPSSTTFYTSPSSSTFGQPVVLTATVSPSTATGSVEFFNGSTSLGTVTLNNAQAQMTLTTLPVGTNALHATYSGDANFLDNVSYMGHTVSKATPTVALSASPSTSITGQTVTLTASVTPNAATGTVQFLNGATVLGTANITSGQAQLTTSTLPVGSNSLTATYSGDANYSSTTSAAITAIVNPKTATTTTVASGQNPSFAGSSVTFTATVSPSAATGTVQFLDGAAVLGTGTLAGGTTAFSTSSLAQGTHSVTAVYSGDATNAGSTSAALSQAVKLSAGMTMGVSPSPAVVGQTVAIMANMNSAATGTVQFTDGSTTLATVPVASGIASYSTSTLTAGTHTLGIAYSGDATYMSASASFNETVLAASTIAIVSNVNPSTVAQSVTFTASVTPATATGTVQFFDGPTAIGTAPLASGAASISTASLAQGTHSITANYSGSAAVAQSYSAALTQTVKAVAAVSLVSSVNPSTASQSVSFTASVTPSSATGTVQFLDGASVIGTVGVSSGSAVFSTAALAQGTHSITVVYSGDALDTAATSGAVSQSVKVSTTTSLTSSPDPSTFGNSVTLTATVTPSSTTGTVQFFNGGTSLGSGTLSGGTASLSTTALAAGANSLTATYTGNATSFVSTSSVRIQTVNKTNSSTTFAASPASPAHLNQTVTFTATVTPAAATGTVQFKDNGTVIGTATISNGTAVFSTSSLALGDHPIRAVYAGDSNVNSSQSGQHTYKIVN